MLVYGAAVLRQGVKEEQCGIPGTAQLMGLGLESVGRLEETGGICQFVDLQRTSGYLVFFLGLGREKGHIYRVKL